MPTIHSEILRPVFVTALMVGLFRFAGASPVQEAKRPITVADSIAMTRLVDPSPVRAYPTSDFFKVSPDGKHFVVVTRKGDLRADTNRYELQLFNVDEVLAFLNEEDPDRLPARRILASFESTPKGTGWKRPGGISGVRWLPDSQTVAFVGERLNQMSQAFAVAIRTGELRQLTDHPTHVRRFDISADSESIIYVARDDPPDWANRNRYGYAVESENLRDLVLLSPDEVSFNEDAFYLSDRSKKTSKKFVSKQFTLTRDVWLSPNGRWAIGQAFANDMPASWLTEYESWEGIGVGYAKQRYVGNSAFLSTRGQVTRYVLIDTMTGAIEPVTHAPAAAGGAKEVHWASNSQSAIIVNTHLPLEGVDEQELRRRRETAAIIEFHVTSRRVAPIDYFPARFGGDRIIGTRLLEDGVLLVQYGPHTGRPRTTIYRKEHGHWAEESEDPSRFDNARLLLSISQDMNTPPDILADDSATGKRRLITDLNPQLRELSIGRMETFSWTDKNERHWEGGLLFPPDYHRGERYPLVIQTYGFSPDEFLIDGPRGITSAFAARPIAGRKMVVLQMPNQPLTNGFEYVSPSEGHSYIAAYEAVVQALYSDGVIDRSRVGIIGWSRTGMHVSYAVTFSELRFAAATIADSTSAGYLSYVYTYGEPFPGMIENEQMIGGPFWGEDRQLWLDRSPNLNAHRVFTPLRIEAYGTRLNSYWGMFSVLKLHSRPVEMIHIPLASHLLQRPQARYSSQQGNVDWFAFWLQGYEDPDPSKADQYRRWRKLCRQHRDATDTKSTDCSKSSTVSAVR